MITDSHTHSHRPDAIVSRSPESQPHEGFLYSVGIHPWDADSSNLPLLEEEAALPSTIAIGESGIDLLRGPEVEQQEKLFIKHIELSERLKKPLIVHCVRAFDRLLSLRRKLHPKQPWIIHGFNRKPQLAAELVKAGCYISFGPVFNPASARAVPSDRLLIETDDSPECDINTVATAVAEARGESAQEILNLSSTNLKNIFGYSQRKV